MQDLAELYRDLPSIEGQSDTYATTTLHHRARYKVGRDPLGNPALLIAAEPAADGAGVPALEFPNLSFRPRCSCNVTQEGLHTTEILAVLKCTADDETLRDHFLKCLSGAVEALPQVPTEDRIAAAVSELAELFRALAGPPRSSLQGLWCELLLIAKSQDVSHVGQAWHADPNETYDFSSGRAHVEVKSTTRLLRIHKFSLAQLMPPAESHCLVVSFLLHESANGSSITDLWGEVERRSDIGADMLGRMRQVLHLALGRDWKKAGRVAFDVGHAIEGMQIFDARTIPKVSPDMPPEVSDVHFSSELTAVPRVGRRDAANRGQLFKEIFAPFVR